MEKPIILVEIEMKEDFAKVVNKYIGQIPAMHIVTALESITNELNNIASIQIEAARKEYESAKEESENDS